MPDFIVGDCVKVALDENGDVKNPNNHNYRQPGKAHVVHEIGSNGVVRLKDPETGTVGNWVRLADLEVASDWEEFAAVLPEEDRKLLELTRCPRTVRIPKETKARAVASLPMAKELFFAAADLLSRMPAPAPGNDDDDDNLFDED